MFVRHRMLFRLTGRCAPGKIAEELSGERLCSPCGIDHYLETASPGLLLLLTPEMFGHPLAHGSRWEHSKKDASQKDASSNLRGCCCKRRQEPG